MPLPDYATIRLNDRKLTFCNIKSWSFHLVQNTSGRMVKSPVFILLEKGLSSNHAFGLIHKTKYFIEDSPMGGGVLCLIKAFLDSQGHHIWSHSLCRARFQEALFTHPTMQVAKLSHPTLEKTCYIHTLLNLFRFLDIWHQCSLFSIPISLYWPSKYHLPFFLVFLFFIVSCGLLIAFDW